MKIKLANGIKIRIESDPGLVMSGVGLSVEAGSWQDPRDALGLAHFVEHMLFMGTKSHPTPGAFDAYLSSVGGPMANAQTGAQKTTYGFGVPHRRLLQALWLFAEFFVEPLFDASSTDRERNAVNQVGAVTLMYD